MGHWTRGTRGQEGQGEQGGQGGQGRVRELMTNGKGQMTNDK